MTLLPSEDWQITGVEGDRYKVGPWCEAPGCKRPVDHKHHLWRRSFLSGDFWWVKVSTGETIRNVVGLCWHHHEAVTGTVGGHQAWIKWVGGTDFAWLERNAIDTDWIQTGTLSLPAPSEFAVSDGSGREAERCPTCGKKKSKGHVEHEPGPKRPSKSWTIKVPADHEDGAMILDELSDICAEIFGHDEYTGQIRRYYTVVQALATIVQNREMVESEVDA